MNHATHPRIYVPAPLASELEVVLDSSQSHYLAQVMRLKQGDAVRLFNGQDGEWIATIRPPASRKQGLICKCSTLHVPQRPSPDLMVCVAPPRGGRMESIFEKATELGAQIIQPVRTRRSVVDRIHHEKALATLREAAEQSERLDIPQLRPMVTLPELLGSWNPNRTLIFGDESGESGYFLPFKTPISETNTTHSWAILVGPEGGFTEEERTQIHAIPAALGVGLGPRILRVDTAVITLCALTQSMLGDWHHRPRFIE
jgi:16S rRNA (uracil1498-N3)-methyltransferase